MRAGGRPAGPDSEGLGAALAGAATAFEAAGEAALGILAGLRPPEPPRAVLLLAGPRAAPAAEAAAALLRASSPAPVEVASAAELPAYVGPGSLLLLAALGPTEAGPVASLGAAAAERGADVLLAGAGGALARVGEVATHDWTGAGSPAALAPLVEVLPALLAAAGWAGLLGELGEDVLAEAASALAAAAAGLDRPEGGLHEVLARHIGRTIPLFEGAGGIGAVAARSWRRSWNLLAKAPAFATTEPLASFEEVSGFGQHGDVTRQLLTLVCLRTPVDGPEDQDRSRLLAELAGEALAGTLEIGSPGDGPVGALVHLEWLGAATAYARARQEGLDPGPLPAADEVEDRLRRRRRSRRGGDGLA